MFHFTVINKPTMAAIMGEKLMFGASSPQEYSPNTTDEPDIEDPRVLKGIAVVECILMAFGVCGNVMLFILMQSKRMKKYFFFLFIFHLPPFSTHCLYFGIVCRIFTTWLIPTVLRKTLLLRIPSAVAFWNCLMAGLLPRLHG